MLCKSYERLTVPERTTVIGQIVHCLQNDEECFVAIMDLIQDAKINGVFNGVLINHDIQNKLP